MAGKPLLIIDPQNDLCDLPDACCTASAAAPGKTLCEDETSPACLRQVFNHQVRG